MHGNHHAVPNDPLRNLMPPVVSLPVAGLIWVGMLALIGPGGNWLFLGVIGGYAGYALVHYACTLWPMKGLFARMLQTPHMRHHILHALGNSALPGMLLDDLFPTRTTPTIKTQIS